MRCRHCNTPLELPLVDLGSAPPSNNYLTSTALKAPELWFPLRVLVCHSCWLVQTEDFARADELFNDDYAYFSGFSASWVDHAKQYVQKMTGRLALDKSSLVIEVAANDGYLLQHVKERGVPCLGIEPTASTASAAREKGISIIQEFFGVALGERLATEGRQADLTVANNVLAHVPDINDFSGGFARVLKPAGVATFEFPHVLNLIEQSQFDTIYHEHFSYLSLVAVQRIFAANGLFVFDVEELPTHGGSVRLYAQRSDTGERPVSARVETVMERELAAGLTSERGYTGFQAKADRVKDDFVAFLINAKEQGKRVAGYGAAAKGNTLLNYGGVKSDLLSFVVDRNPAKQSRYLPGSRIPVVSEQRLQQERPDYVVILPWNLSNEVMNQLAYIREWGAVFVTAVPTLRTQR